MVLQWQNGNKFNTLVCTLLWDLTIVGKSVNIGQNPREKSNIYGTVWSLKSLREQTLEKPMASFF